MKNFVKKYCYFTIPVATCIIIFITYLSKVLNFTNIFIDEPSNLIQISGTLIGFLLTAMTIFLSLPKETKLMERIKKYNHHKIFSRCVSMGLIILTIDILLWLIKVSYIYYICIFIRFRRNTYVCILYL